MSCDVTIALEMLKPHIVQPWLRWSRIQVTSSYSSDRNVLLLRVLKHLRQPNGRLLTPTDDILYSVLFQFSFLFVGLTVCRWERRRSWRRPRVTPNPLYQLVIKPPPQAPNKHNVLFSFSLAQTHNMQTGMFLSGQSCLRCTRKRWTYSFYSSLTWSKEGGSCESIAPGVSHYTVDLSLRTDLQLLLQPSSESSILLCVLLNPSIFTYLNLQTS